MKSNVWICATVVSFSSACGASGREQQQPLGDSKVLVTPNAPNAQKTCGISDAPHVTSTGIGRLQIGTSIEEVRENCAVLADTFEIDAEAMPQRVLLVDLSEEQVRALIENDRIWRIEIDGQTLRTSDSLGVGVTLPTLLANDKVTAIEGEGRLYALLPRHCGLSFRLTYSPKDHEHRSTWTAGDLLRLPHETTVDRILVTGCERTTGEETSA